MYSEDPKFRLSKNEGLFFFDFLLRSAASNGIANRSPKADPKLNTLGDIFFIPSILFFILLLCFFMLLVFVNWSCLGRCYLG